MTKKVQYLKKYQQKRIVSLWYGISAFLSTAFVQIFHPLDLIKTRLQSHDGRTRNVVPKYNGLFNALSKIYFEEGIRGLYKGVYSALIGQTSSHVLFFIMYEQRKKTNSLRYGEEHLDKIIFRSSAESSLFAGTLLQPVYVLKTRLMLNANAKLSGWQRLLISVRNIYRKHGMFGFYRGSSLTLGLMGHEVLHYQLYEHFLIYFKDPNSQIQHAIKPLISGILSKTIATLVFYPLQTLRTRRQQDQFYCHEGKKSYFQPKYEGIKDIVNQIYKFEGIKGFYKGLGINLLRTVPSKGFFFFFYEMFKDAFVLNDLEKP